MGCDYRLKLSEISRAALLGWHREVTVECFATDLTPSLAVAQKGYKALIVRVRTDIRGAVLHCFGLKKRTAQDMAQKEFLIFGLVGLEV